LEYNILTYTGVTVSELVMLDHTSLYAFYRRRRGLVVTRGVDQQGR